KGKWNTEFFSKPKPITLELGCGKGEYTVALSAAHPERNFLGVDIKGSRIWRGARTAFDNKMDNVGFLRTQVERINNFFIPGEIDEIWITFPDPQPQKTRERKRLTSPLFLDKYRKILKPGGLVHLKTDSAFLFDYSLMVIEQQKLHVLRKSHDIDRDYPGDELLKIRTYYEMKFRETGVPINYVCFEL
ncbi:MAG: tRNA (guanosine(46)-N7)-methyltransferase TrmB, partial [Bacteroidetes bacterium]|nr:tRNA (guanosine(46)-N7)-methyltransferase TrmB [Bacteroidota bacterium]